MDYGEFKFVDDDGTITYVSAKCRTQAIENYCREKGCPKEYVKEHCIIRPFCRGRQNGKGGEK